MKKVLKYNIGDKVVEREVQHIPIRYIVAWGLTFFEFFAIILIVAGLCFYVPYFYILAWVTQVGVVLKIISSDDNPEYKVPWLFFVLVVPIVGFMSYIMFRTRKLKRKYIKKLKDVYKERFFYEDKENLERLKTENIYIHNQAKLLCEISESFVFKNTKQKYYPLGEDMFKDLLVDLNNAKKFIFMEYFIIEDGKFWSSILEILKKKASEGVEVKIVYDDIGCMLTLPGNYVKQLKKFKIDCVSFAKMKGDATGEFNNRSHRKITVIDGVVGYTGGINIADEYINEFQKYGHWKDTAVRLEGEAVRELTRLFLIDYEINSKTVIGEKKGYLEVDTDVKCEDLLVPFGDGPSPLYKRRVGKSIIQSMIESATKSVCITTPYLIIDNDMCTTLENAALRGVDVKIITPHIPDKKIVFGMTRSFYPRLRKAGIKIYEYEPGFIHAKSYLVDDKVGMLGTINMDYRSLVHHFENGVWFYGGECVEKLKTDFEETLQKCIKIEKNTIKNNFLQTLVCAVVRLIAPLL